MQYFYDIYAQANEENELKFLMQFAGEIPAEGLPSDKLGLTAEMIKKNPAYAEFAKAKFPLVMLTYGVYRIDSDLSKIADINAYLNSLIENKTAEFVTNGELQITAKGGGKKKKKKKLGAKMTGFIIAGAALLSLVCGVGVGTLFNSDSAGSLDVLINDNDDPNRTDCLIMPDAVQFSPNAELLTVSIDRSWSAVPREDLQVKGEIIDSVAKIALPAFDRNDFFSHVAGYTWGFTSDPAGTRIEYYGGGTYAFTENIKLYRILVKYGGGNGTQDDPYLINYFDQLQLMSQEKVGDTGSVRGVYFRQTEDIFFPSWANNTPINTVNELKLIHDLERFEYDGGGFSIEGLTAPLFGTVSGSVIRNVNITGALIETIAYENHGFLVKQAYNYRYEVDGDNRNDASTVLETGETLIKNCTVSHSTMNLVYPTIDEKGNAIPETVPPVTAPPAVIPPNLELPDGGELSGEAGYTTAGSAAPPKHGEFAIGGITGVGGQIENCLVTDVVITAELDDYFLYVGGISGKPANVINSGVSYLTIKGNIFNAGGIVGSAGGTRLYSDDGAELPIFYGGNIQGCFVHNFAGYVENAAGGIAGEASANTENAIISNSYATNLDLRVGIFDDDERKIPVTLGISGGIIGTDGSENYGHLITNTVSPGAYPVIGFAKLSSYDETVRLAPPDAFYQTGILDVINKNTVHPNNPAGDGRSAVIFTGNFMFAKDDINTDQSGSDDGGSYAFPAEIEGLLEKTEVSHE